MYGILSNISHYIKKINNKYKYKKYDFPVVKSYWKCLYKYTVKDTKKNKVIKEVLCNNAYEIMSDFAECGLYFPYQHNGIRKNNVEECMNSGGHCHSIDELFLTVYLYPISFQIEEQFKDYYSTQELKCIDKIKKKCMDCGLKDVSSFDMATNTYIEYTDELRKRGIKKL